MRASWKTIISFALLAAGSLLPLPRVSASDLHDLETLLEAGICSRIESQALRETVAWFRSATAPNSDARHSLQLSPNHLRGLSPKSIADSGGNHYGVFPVTTGSAGRPEIMKVEELSSRNSSRLEKSLLIQQAFARLKLAPEVFGYTRISDLGAWIDRGIFVARNGKALPPGTGVGIFMEPVPEHWNPTGNNEPPVWASLIEKAKVEAQVLQIQHVANELGVRMKDFQILVAPDSRVWVIDFADYSTTLPEDMDVSESNDLIFRDFFRSWQTRMREIRQK